MRQDQPYLEYAKHELRLLYPQRRTGPKGSGQFERISWQEALEEIASNLKDTIDRSGAEAIWPYAGAGTIGWIQGIVGSGKRLFHALGSSAERDSLAGDDEARTGSARAR